MEYVNQNLSADTPYTPLEAGTYIDCNLTNRQPAAGTVIIRCNTSQVTRNQQVGTRSITVGGRTVTINTYADQVLGYISPRTLRLIARAREAAVEPPEGTRDAIILQAIRDYERAEADRDSASQEIITND